MAGSGCNLSLIEDLADSVEQLPGRSVDEEGSFGQSPEQAPIFALTDQGEFGRPEGRSGVQGDRRGRGVSEVVHGTNAIVMGRAGHDIPVLDEERST